MDYVSFSLSQPLDATARHVVSAGTVTKGAVVSHTEEVVYSIFTVVSTKTAFMSVAGSQGTWTANDQTSSTPAATRRSGLSVAGTVGVCLGTFFGAGLLATLIFLISWRFRKKRTKQPLLGMNRLRSREQPRNPPALQSPEFGTASGAFAGPAQIYSYYEPTVFRNVGAQRESWEDRPFSAPLMSRHYGLDRGEQSNIEHLGGASNPIDLMRIERSPGTAQHTFPISPEPNARELLTASQARRLRLESSIEEPLPTHQENRRPSFLPELQIPSPLQIHTPTVTTPPRVSIPRKGVGTGNSRPGPTVKPGLQTGVGPSQMPPTIEEEDQTQHSAQAPATSQTPAVDTEYHTPLQQLEDEENSKPPRSSPEPVLSDLPPASSPSNPSNAEGQAQTSNGVESRGNKEPLTRVSGASSTHVPTIGSYDPRTFHYVFPSPIRIPNAPQRRPVSPTQSLSPMSRVSTQDVPSPLSPATPPQAHSTLQNRSRAESPARTTRSYTPYGPASPPHINLPVSQFNPLPYSSPQTSRQPTSSPFTPTSGSQYAERSSPLNPLSQPPQGPQHLPRGPQELASPERQQQENDAPIPLESLAPSGLNDRGSSVEQLGSARAGDIPRVEGDGGGERRLEGQGERSRWRLGHHESASQDSSISGGHAFDELPPGMPGFYGA